MTYQPTYADLLRLAALFHEAQEAGFGIAHGATFEAFPGLEIGAADFLEHRLVELGADAT